MKRPILALVAVAAAVATAWLLWGLWAGPGQPGDPSEPVVDVAPGGDSKQGRSGSAATKRASSPDGSHLDGPRPESELTPQQLEKRARLAERDAAATEKRRLLFQSNIASVSAAIDKAVAEGGNPEYIEALRQRHALLSEQAEAEAQSAAASSSP